MPIGIRILYSTAQYCIYIYGALWGPRVPIYGALWGPRVPGLMAQRFRTERIRRASPERMQLFNQFSPDTLRANTFFTLCFLCIRVEVCILRRIRSGPPDTLERIRRSRFILPERIQRSFFRRIRSDPAGYAQIQPDTLRF